MFRVYSVFLSVFLHLNSALDLTTLTPQDPSTNLGDVFLYNNSKNYIETGDNGSWVCGQPNDEEDPFTFCLEILMNVPDLDTNLTMTTSLQISSFEITFHLSQITSLCDIIVAFVNDVTNEFFSYAIAWDGHLTINSGPNSPESGALFVAPHCNSPLYQVESDFDTFDDYMVFYENSPRWTFSNRRIWSMTDQAWQVLSDNYTNYPTPISLALINEKNKIDGFSQTQFISSFYSEPTGRIECNHGSNLLAQDLSNVRVLILPVDRTSQFKVHQIDLKMAYNETYLSLEPTMLPTLMPSNPTEDEPETTSEKDAIKSEKDENLLENPDTLGLVIGGGIALLCCLFGIFITLIFFYRPQAKKWRKKEKSLRSVSMPSSRMTTTQTDTQDVSVGSPELQLAAPSVTDAGSQDIAAASPASPTSPAVAPSLAGLGIPQDVHRMRAASASPSMSPEAEAVRPSSGVLPELPPIGDEAEGAGYHHRADSSDMYISNLLGRASGVGGVPGRGRDSGGIGQLTNAGNEGGEMPTGTAAVGATNGRRISDRSGGLIGTRFNGNKGANRVAGHTDQGFNALFPRQADAQAQQEAEIGAPIGGHTAGGPGPVGDGDQETGL